MHDHRHVHMMGALADQMLSEYGDAMHEAVQDRAQVAITNSAAKAAGVPAKKEATKAPARMQSKKKPTGLLAWLFGL